MTRLLCQNFLNAALKVPKQQSSCHEANAPPHVESVPLVVKVACFCLLAQSGVGVDYSFFFIKDFFFG